MDSKLTNKMKLKYFRPMVVVRRARNGTYCLAKLDRAVSHLHYTAFRIIPYFSHSQMSISVTCILNRDDLTSIVNEDVRLSNGALDVCNKHLTRGSQI